MVASKKVINKKYIKDYVYNNLWMLNKEDIQYLLRKNNIDFKSKETKNILIDRLKSNKKINFWEIYKEYQTTFSISLWDLQELLNIDNKMRKKLTEKGFLKVNRWEEKKATFGKYDAPFYDLETLYKMDISKLEELKEKYKPKERTQKQKEGARKAAETRARKKEEEYQKKLEKVTLETTCVRCKVPMMDYNLLDWEGICDYCNKELDFLRLENSVIYWAKKIIKNKDNYLILDAETTDLNFDDICSVSIIDFNGNVKLNTLIRPMGKIDFGATWCHGVKNDDVVDAPNASFLKEQLELILKENKTILYFSISFSAMCCYLKKNKIDVEFLNNINIENICRKVADWEKCDDLNYLRRLSAYFPSGLEEKENVLHSLEDCFRIKNFIETASLSEYRKIE